MKESIRAQKKVYLNFAEEIFNDDLKMKALMPEIFHKNIINNIFVISAKYQDHTPIFIFSSMWQ